MAFTRRQWLAGLAAAAAARAQSRAGNAMRPRVTPAVCLYSKVLIDIGYIDLPPILAAIGFDGVDLSVEPGGHVPPQEADYFLMPALEGFTGRGLDVPMISTGILSLQDPNAQTVVGLASYIGVPFFRPGHWKLTGAAVAGTLLPAMQRAIAGLAQLGRATGMAMGIHNFLDGDQGAAVADINRMIRPIDPRWAGFDFDVGYAAAEGGDGGFAGPLALALPRLKTVTVRDFKWEPSPGGPRKMAPCPLGEGVVDWPGFFAALVKAKFAGPISMTVDYQPKDKLSAVKQDLAFLREQISTAYR